uniref:calcium-binding protein n=1 Tax=Xanthomonas sp. 0924 TaxID=2835534 RepID=UPI003F7CDF3E
MEFSDSEKAYAQFAANVYAAVNNDVNGNPLIRSELNALPLPGPEWTKISERVTGSGFMAKAFRNSENGEVVVSYAGTTQENLLDWILGNIPAGVGAYSVQVEEAIAFYLDVLKIPNVSASSVTFTGHSLGGGLASLMAVFFDKNATVFDQAPFEMAAMQFDSIQKYKDNLENSGYVIPLELKEYGVGSFSERESNVTQILVAGEVLTFESGNFMKINGAIRTIDPMAKKVLGWGEGGFLEAALQAVDLHSISLLAGFMNSDKFLDVARKYEELLPRIFHGAYAGFIPQKKNISTLLDLLVQRQVLGEGSLDILADDISKINSVDLRAPSATYSVKVGGDERQFNLVAALIDVALAGIYEQANGRTPGNGSSVKIKSVLTEQDGYLAFDAQSIGGQEEVGIRSMRDYIIAVWGESINSALSENSRWGVQNGSRMDYVSSDFDVRSDVVVALHGSNTIKVGGGDDLVLGGDGDDDISGGSGDDLLYGGAGFDTYRFLTNESLLVSADRIYDSGGDGAVYVDNVAVTAGVRLTETTWADSTGNLRLTMIADPVHRLIVTNLLSGDTIHVERWQNGQLGISLGGEIGVLPPVGTKWDGDLTPEGANINGVFQGNEEAEAFYTGFGEDVIDAAGGIDVINGGSGSDVINGGDGNDFIVEVARTARNLDRWIGAPPTDRVLASGVGFMVGLRSGNAEDARTYYEDVFLGLVGTIRNGGPSFYPDPELFADGGDVIDGGGGSDLIMSGEGNDIVDGGIGNDVISGGHDSDILMGNDGDDLIFGDRINGVLAGEEVANLSSAARADGDDIIDGGAGNDELRGDGGNDQIWGGQGDDVILGDTVGMEASRQGNDSLHGGEGQDQIWGGGGNDTISGDAGNDTIFGDFVVGQLDPQFHGADRISGGVGMDWINGQGGDDVIDGGDDADTLLGGAGADVINGGTGYDLIVGDDFDAPENEQGNDTINGGLGDDTILGMGGNDQLVGGEGNDSLYGDDQVGNFAGNDKLSGNTGDDYLDGGRGDDQLDGGTGNDTLIGAEGNDTYLIKAGDGHDVVSGLGDQSAGSDTIALSGLSRNEATFRRSGSALVMTFGTDQSVRLEGFLARDNGGHRIVFGDGSVVDRDEALRLLNTGTAAADQMQGSDQDDELYGEGGNDTLDGQDGNDSLNGGTGNDFIFGGGGNDILNGEDGDDELDGGAGNDLLNGGAGNNVYRFGRGYGDDIVTADDPDAGHEVRLIDIADVQQLGFSRMQQTLILTILATGETLEVNDFFGPSAANTRVLFSDGSVLSSEQIWAGANVIHGSIGDDLLDGMGGDDLIEGLLGDDRILGGDGNDVMYGDNQYSPYWWEPGGADRMEGGAGDDRMYGNSGNDVMSGGEGDDALHGGRDDDRLVGGSGNDSLVGEGGSDVYVFGRGHGTDRILETGAGLEDFEAIEYDATVAPSDIVVRRNSHLSDDLTLHIDGTDDSVTIISFFDALGEGQRPRINVVRFADGTVWTVDDLISRSLQGSDRDDNLIVVRARAEVIDGGAGNDNVFSLEYDDMLSGGAGNDALKGGGGNDVLDGGSGSDLLVGGAGDDVYRFGVGSGVDFIHNGSGDASDYDVIELSVDVSTDDVRLARAGDALVIDIGNAGDRLVVLDHFLDGDSAGAIDALRFADGTLWTTAEILAQLGPGLDPISIEFDNNRYADQPAAPGYIIGVQNAGGDYYGAQSASTLFDLGRGEVRQFGGQADDIYVFGRGYNQHTIIDAGGTDQIRLNAGVSPESVSLARLGDRLIVQLSEQDLLTVNGFFGSGGGVIESLLFADGTRWDSSHLQQHAVSPDVERQGGDGDDLLQGGIGDDRLYGNAGNDTLEGGKGSDLLDGGSGADVMHGGEGSDTYLVDESGDVVVDDGYPSDPWSMDINTVRSQVSYTLGNNLQQLILDGTADLGGTGNEESNILLGNTGANVLLAAAFDAYSYQADWIDGGAGDDILVGAWGNDTLIGGSGNDRMQGGGGDDLYFVESVGDVVIETGDAGGGSFAQASVDTARVSADVGSDATVLSGMEPEPFGALVPGEHRSRSGDTVAASIDFTLGENLEALLMFGNAIFGTGNELDNMLSGNAHDNVLSGLDGYDSLFGGAGSDALYGGDGGDQLYGEDGDDTLAGGDGDDSYYYRVGQGHDTIVNVDAYGEDVLYLNEASFDQFSFTRTGDDMVATFSDQSGSLTFKNWYTESANRVDRLYDQNWMELTSDQVDSLVGGAELSQLIGAMAQGEAGQEVYAQSWSERGNQPHLMIAAV